MMTNNRFIISSIEDKPELELMISWAKKEGWNPGKYDAKTFYNTDSQGFFIGKLNNEPIGCISAISYDEYFGFLGFYIVQPEFRGKGYGIQLWRHTLAHLKDRNIGLDGVVAQQENYKKFGFKIAYNNIRYQYIIDDKNYDISNNLIDLNKVDFSELIAYDNQCFPTSRERFLSHWIKQEKSEALGFVQNQQLLGYGIIRPSDNGYRIGGLYADNLEIADIIYQGLTINKNNCSVFMDIPSDNIFAKKIAEKYQMLPVFETARMYNKTIPDVAINKIFGVTTLELG